MEEQPQKCPHCKGTGYADKLGSTPETLHHLMSNISEDHWCAGWLIGLEYELWDIVVGLKANNLGWDRVPDARINQLKIVANEADCWMAWNPIAIGVRPVNLFDWVILRDLCQLLDWWYG